MANSITNAKNADANLFPQGIKDGASKKNSWRSGYMHMVILSESLPNFSKSTFTRRSFWGKRLQKITIPNQLIDWDCVAQDAETLKKMYERLKKWNVKVFFSDQYSAYRDFIPHKCLIQTKIETHLIEDNNFPQRHWFARFRLKTFRVSRSLEMIDLTMFVYAAFHVNKSIDTVI